MKYAEDFIFPDATGFRGETLDDYLAAGYYRMQHLLYTADYTQPDLAAAPLPVFWLRTVLKCVPATATMRSIEKKCAAFTVELHTAAITREVEELYDLYRSAIDFNGARDCKSYLHDPSLANPFTSFMFLVYDAQVLVAVGFFDVGLCSLMGIMNFYHPSYRACSLGKFLMLQKIAYARSRAMGYYYTGYLSTGTPKFDYKIFPAAAAMEVYLREQNVWVPFAREGKKGLMDLAAAWRK